MKNSELIEKLKTLPPDAEVKIGQWDYEWEHVNFEDIHCILCEDGKIALLDKIAIENDCKLIIY